MGIQVVMGAMCKCTMGAAPSVLSTIPTHKTFSGGPPSATIMDNKPFVNILPFGVCMSIANPAVATATAAALGVLTPMHCTPVTRGPWVPGSPTVLIGGVPALNNSSKLMCSYAGVISIVSPGQAPVQVP